MKKLLLKMRYNARNFCNKQKSREINYDGDDGRFDFGS